MEIEFSTLYSSHFITSPVPLLQMSHHGSASYPFQQKMLAGHSFSPLFDPRQGIASCTDQLCSVKFVNLIHLPSFSLSLSLSLSLLFCLVDTHRCRLQRIFYINLPLSPALLYSSLILPACLFVDCDNDARE